MEGRGVSLSTGTLLPVLPFLVDLPIIDCRVETDTGSLVGVVCLPRTETGGVWVHRKDGLPGPRVTTRDLGVLPRGSAPASQPTVTPYVTGGGGGVHQWTDLPVADLHPSGHPESAIAREVRVVTS